MVMSWIQLTVLPASTEALGKADFSKSPHGTVEHAATKNVFANLNTVNLMLPQLLKWGVKLKPVQ